jgi:triosephosphate isomerase
MNGLKSAIGELEALISKCQASPVDADILICPPFTLVASFAKTSNGSSVHIGAQDCHAQQSGAHTGDISAEMLKDAGATHIIIGHSERRADHGESNADIHAKALAIYKVELCAIICVGETEAERDAGQALSIVEKQLNGSIPDSANAENTVVAYEPIWAIGTGRVPSVNDVATVHEAIRKKLIERFGKTGQEMRILYGGSVKPANASELMSVPNVNGALVGGASLKADDFDGIISAYR